MSAFPVPVENKPITNNIYSDNTRSLIIDSNKNLLKIIENIITKLNIVSDNVTDLKNAQLQYQNELTAQICEVNNHIYSTTNAIIDKLNEKPKEKEYKPLLRSTSNSSVSSVRSIKTTIKK